MKRFSPIFHLSWRVGLALSIAAALAPLETWAADRIEPQAQLMKDGRSTAVRIKGRISDDEATGFLVYVGGRLVHSGSGERWSVDVPLAHLRELAEPYSTHVPVTLVTTDSEGQRLAELDQRVQLPVGLLGLRNPDRPIRLSAY